MFRLFDNSKKKKREDTQIAISSSAVTNQVVQQMTQRADATFSKPKYNPQTRKEHYDNGSSHKIAKHNAFSGDGTAKDPYTNAELVLTIKEAKMRFGEKWQEHLAEADHIDPLNKIANRSENNPWLTTDDVKNIGNSQDNFQVISRRMNQSGNKGGSTQTEWSRDYEKMKRISEQTGDPIEVVVKKIRQTGEMAERRNNAKLVQTSIKNMANTAHTAGVVGASQAGGTAATISGIYNIVSCINGEKTVTSAVGDVVCDGSKAFFTGYTKSAGLTVLNHTLSSSKSQFLAMLGKNNVAGKVINVVSVTGTTVVKWGNGEISTEECMVELGDKGCSAVGAHYAGMLGQTVIPIPVVGYAVGSLIGGVLTSEVYNGIVHVIQSTTEEERRRQQEIYEALMKYYAEQQRRKEVQQLIRADTAQAVVGSVQTIMQSGEFQRLFREAKTYFSDYDESRRRVAEYVLVTLQLNEYRKQLQGYINQYFSGYEHCFSEALNLMDSSLKMGDYNGAIIGTNRITRLFGKTPTVKNTEEFKKTIFGNGDISF